MLNSGERNHPCLVPDLRSKGFSISLLSIMFTVDFSCIDFIMLGYFSSISVFSLYHEMLNCVSNASFCIKWGDHLFFFFSFHPVKWCIPLINFHMLNVPCIPEINSIRSWFIILYTVEFSLQVFFFRIFAIFLGTFAVQQIESVIHIHICTLFQIFFPFRLLQSIE